MTIEFTLAYLFIVAFFLFLLRWALNWVILNRVNKTSYSLFRTDYSISDYFPLIKHIAISEWKIWWKGDDQKKLKGYSNVLSGGLYILILVIVMLIVILKVNAGV